MIDSLNLLQKNNEITVNLPINTLSNTNIINNFILLIYISKINVINSINNNIRSLFRIDYSINNRVFEDLIVSITVNKEDEKLVELNEIEIFYILNKNNININDNCEYDKHFIKFFLPILSNEYIRFIQKINQTSEITINILISNNYSNHINIPADYIFSNNGKYKSEFHVEYSNQINQRHILPSIPSIPSIPCIPCIKMLTLPCDNHNISGITIYLKKKIPYFTINSTYDIDDLYFDMFLNNNIDILNSQKLWKKMFNFNSKKSIIIPSIYNSDTYNISLAFNNFQIKKTFIDLTIIFENMKTYKIEENNISYTQLMDNINVDNEFINKLQLTQISDICPISHNIFNENEIVLSCSECKKIFKRLELMKWLQNKDTCPWCCKKIEVVHFKT